MPTCRVSVLAVAVAVCLAACGGSSNGAGGVGVSWKIPATDARYITTSGVSTAGLDQVSVGDDELDRRWVVVLLFDVSGLSPAAADKVELSFHRTHNAGFPFTDLGALQIDHIAGGAPIIATQFGGFTLVSGFANAGSQDDYLIDVTARVQQDLADGRTHSIFRLRFDPVSDGDGAYDQARIATSTWTYEPDRPFLVVTENP